MEVDVLERFYAVTNEALEEAKNEVSFRLLTRIPARAVYASSFKGRGADYDHM